VCLAERVPDTGDLDDASGAVARSFYPRRAGDIEPVLAWLRGEEAQSLLATIEAGYHCELLWSGDPVATWTGSAWEAGHQLYLRIEGLLGP
jgi:hypothetical protein